VLPNLGQPCGNTASCIYGTCSSDTAITAVCQTGYWEWRGANCPQ
jgi:hypothetical protein